APASLTAALLAAALAARLVAEIAPHRLLSRKAASCDLVTAPTFWASTVPFLNRISVGMPRMLNLGGVAGLSSMLSLAIRILSLYWSAISSRMGAIILQGPHHSAQKSSNTGLSDFNTSLSNVASLVWTILGLLTAEIPPLGDSIVRGGFFVGNCSQNSTK